MLSDPSAYEEKTTESSSTGTWPAADSLVDALAAAFAQAAEAEKEPERRQRLRAVADGLGGALRDIAVAVVSKRLGEL